ncbi:very short patch repair endonuclease [Methylopila sp. Yamaguchi]|uniref:very short patch repair endonuclease n=1 Tax=Methylopila sp. Yamaguchi TaxID=1437817 RepID=UPI000CC8A0AD|nr:very short patch repair endonuclease [Methylopila sp. Yamaguchi]GBD47054.1 DNA mismatch endonuclease Vsr [Methylopila sp. Yamaguchi]
MNRNPAPPQTPEARSAVMRAVKGRNTKPEMLVRRAAHALGYRFRLHRKDLPGSPDLVFPARRKVIFVHGCFWHGHDCARGSRMPKTNAEYWRAKIDRNRARDVRALDDLAAQGWGFLVLWECELRDAGAIDRALRDFLDQGAGCGSSTC